MNTKGDTEKSSLDYRFVTKEYYIYETYGDSSYKQECVGIGLYDSNKDIVYPTPVTDFIKNKFRKKNGGLSTQKNPAHEVCKFLNYCREQAHIGNKQFVELKHAGLFGLKLVHGSIYISEISARSRDGKLSVSYANRIINYLNMFYRWLQEREIIQETITEIYKEKIFKYMSDGKEKTKKVLVLNDVFDKPELDTLYPNSKDNSIPHKLVDFGKYRYELSKEFIDIAEKEANDIYIGVLLQFLGGLRQGEVVNVTKDCLLTKPEGYILDIQDNQELLFPEKKSLASEQVKNPREQPLLWNRRLEFAWGEQLERLEFLRKKGIVTNRKALLVVQSTGKVITGSMYREQFNHVRDLLIEKMSMEGREYEFQFLTSAPWSSHLARGVFTNFCFDLGMTVSEVALARGDAGLGAIMRYVERLSAVETMTDALNKIKTAFDDKDKKHSSLISSKYLSAWGGMW